MTAPGDAVNAGFLAYRVASVDEGGAMGIVVTAIVGGIIGWLASIVMKTNAQMGIIANVIVGIVGSALGHYLAGVMGIAAGGLGGLLVGVAGAVLLIVILKALGVFS
jgi:uncharacterized membrane protein YeaQ/YmgE (transglycosylase-associated protein family)